MSNLVLRPIAGAHRLLLVVGPSGAGKDSVLRGWREALGAAAPAFAQRVITRAPDASEAHEAVTGADFAGMRAQGLLATWWQAHGLDYGVRWREFEPLARGRWVVLNGSRAHLGALRAQAPGLRVVEVSAPPHVLASRLAARAREGAAARDQRLARAIDAPVDADLVLVNDGDLRRSVDALVQWWSGLDAGVSRRVDPAQVRR
jgi:phosphonate metabolism protein PhnN/1,5-bisphosphokinase (PRPP-forming)